VRQQDTLISAAERCGPLEQLVREWLAPGCGDVVVKPLRTGTSAAHARKSPMAADRARHDERRARGGALSGLRDPTGDEHVHVHGRERTFGYHRAVELRQVSSTNVAEIGYDDRTRTLAVRFHNGWRVYLYYAVPPSVHEAFLNAPSKGRFFRYYIKHQYPYARVA
jgi:lysyl-tRNA synthetase class 2